MKLLCPTEPKSACNMMGSLWQLFSLKDSYFLDVCYGSPTLFHLWGFCASVSVFINDLPDLSQLRSHWLLEGAVLANSIMMALILARSVKMDPIEY